MSWTQTITMTSNTSWEDLRKRARQLENEIDAKLVTFNKLGVSLGSQFTRFDVSYSGSSDVAEKAPLLSCQSTFETLSNEISQSLSKLTDLNDKMTEFVHQSGVRPTSGFTTNAALLHTFQRHKDILSFSGGGLNNRRSDAYLKEHEHIRSSDRLLDDQISIAIAAKEHLQSQRSGLRDITKKITTVTKRYPGLNSLMQKISLKKRRDSLVIGGVISVCLILMFLYAWS